MDGGVNGVPKATIGSLVTLLLDGPGAKRVLLTDARCIDAMKGRTEHPEAVVATREPLGIAILMRSPGEQFEYLDGGCMKTGEILAVDGRGPVF
jgi:hypothetical protein